MFGKDVIILEETPTGIIWIEEEKLFKRCEELFPEVAKDENHPLRGKTLIQAIAEDKDDRLGWGKYKSYLKRRGLI